MPPIRLQKSLVSSPWGNYTFQCTLNMLLETATEALLKHFMFAKKFHLQVTLDINLKYAPELEHWTLIG